MEKLFSTRPDPMPLKKSKENGTITKYPKLIPIKKEILENNITGIA